MINKKTGLVVLLAGFIASEIMAGTLTSYANGDVLVCFRKSGTASDFVVDAGPISAFTNAATNARINITQFTTNQLQAVGTTNSLTLNSLSFSAFTWLDDTVSPSNAQWTIFMTRGRSTLTSQTAPWPRAPQTSQTALAGDMGSIVGGAAVCIGYNTLNTSTAAIEPDDENNTIYGVSGRSYFGTLSGTLDFNGNFSGNPEKTTSSSFITSGAVVRSDFYRIPPSFPPLDTSISKVQFLGYFELNTNGLLSYVAYPSGTPTTPIIKSLTRTNTTSYISFTTGTFGTYTLRGTNNLSGSTPGTNWPSINFVTGNGLTNTLQDTTSASNKFYIITAQ
jgi:hypothetical protein